MKNFIVNLFVGLVLISGLSFAGCFDSSKSGGEDVASDAKAITSFIFYDADNEALTSDVAASIDGFAISATVPYGTDVTALVPTVATTGLSVNPASGDAADFTSAVTYTVTAADSTTQEYTVTVTIAASDVKAITSFIFYDLDNEALTSDVTASIDGFAISATVPYGTDVTALVPTIATTGLSVNPASGTAADFMSAVTYTVTAADTTTQEYTVTVTIAASDAKAITSFIFYDIDNEALTSDVVASIDGFAISATIPYGTDVTALVPTIATTGLSVNPASGDAADFTSAVTYTVTAADSTTQEYTVTVTIAASDAKAITSFIFYDIDNEALTSDVAASIDGFAISATVPYGTDVTSLVSTIVTSGQSVNPASGAAANFTDAVTYTVTAENLSTQEYTVTVDIAIRVLFVDIDAAGNEDGSSWGNAFTHPMDAMEVAELGDEIWVAEGIYAPRDDEGTPEDNVMIMKIGVAIYGGFAGTETSIEERDIEGHVTIFDGNGAAIHVVVGADGSHLDGFTITGGNASGEESDGKGGGMYNCETSLVVSNCLFTGNTAVYGGAIYNSGNTIEIADSVFQGNTADDGYGGAIYNDENSSTEISGCDFNENTARGAGAIYNKTNWAIIIDCEFNNNSADLGSSGYGGAICNGNSYVITISRCNFIENRSNHSGGGINTSCSNAGYGTSFNISECTFINNETRFKGGAMRNHYYVQMNVENCLFIGNKSPMNAGGVNISYSTLGNNDGWGKFTNCIFSGNNIQAICAEQGSSYDSVILTNCILWGNLGSEIWPVDQLVVTYSNIYMDEGIHSGEGNINADPLFVDPGYWDDNGTPDDQTDDFWVNGDYHFQAGSPCIDSALGDVFEEPEFYPPEFDMDGNPRYDDPSVGNTGSGDPDYVDMGAYEYQGL